MIYAVEAVGTGYVKFGVAVDMRKRIEMLQIGCPFELMVLAQCDGGRKEEREIHIRLIDAKHRGEWFRLDDSVKAVIADMRSKSGFKPYLSNATRKRLTTEDRESGGWMDDPKTRRHKGINWSAWLKDWEERGRISTRHGVSIARAREIKRKAGGRYAPSIARARMYETVIPPQCGNVENPNQISMAILPTPT